MAQFDERKLDEQLFVACLTVVEVGAVEQVEGGVYELYGTFLRHLRHFVAHTVVGFKKCPGGGIGGHHEVAQVLGEAVDKELRVKAFVAHLLVDE